MAEGQRDGEGIPEQVTSEIFTAANVVSFVRLCLVPVYLWLLLSGFNLAATLVFAAAAAASPPPQLPNTAVICGITPEAIACL